MQLGPTLLVQNILAKALRRIWKRGLETFMKTLVNPPKKRKERKEKMHQRVKPYKFNGIHEVMLKNGSKRLATKNLAPGKNIYGERLVKFQGKEYRIWDPYRSKLAAAILKNIKKVPIKYGQKILYLGAASGTTASHISDIVGAKGHVYCVEFAPRTIRELVNNVCTSRNNISPILEDARFPSRYRMFIDRKVDAIYCDIAQPEQAKILVFNLTNSSAD